MAALLEDVVPPDCKLVIWWEFMDKLFDGNVIDYKGVVLRYLKLSYASVYTLLVNWFGWEIVVVYP